MARRSQRYMLSSSSGEDEDSSEEDALEVSRAADALFDAPRHSVEEWAYRDWQRDGSGEQEVGNKGHSGNALVTDEEMFLASEVPIPEMPYRRPQARTGGKRRHGVGHSTATDNQPRTLRRTGKKNRRKKRTQVKVRLPGSTHESRLKQHARPAWGSPKNSSGCRGLYASPFCVYTVRGPSDLAVLLSTSFARTELYV